MKKLRSYLCFILGHKPQGKIEEESIYVGEYPEGPGYMEDWNYQKCYLCNKRDYWRV